MWSHKRIKGRKEAGIYEGNWGGGWNQILWDGKNVFILEEWAMNCCSIATLHTFDGYFSHEILANPDNVDSLFRYLNDKNVFELWYNAFRPREYLITLSIHQRTQFDKFLKNKYVKFVDKWSNKSHEPHHPIYLFRLSQAQDFKEVVV